MKLHVRTGVLFAMKMNITRFLMLLLIATVLVMTGAEGADAARKKKKSAPQPDRYASIVIDAATGTVLSEKNPDKKLYPASLTKMMTLYMTFEAIDSGRLQKYQRINVSKRASIQEPSKLGLTPGSTIRVQDAILALVTKSANDAAVTLAEAVGGSEPRFAVMMTQKARALGMANTRFINASGLHHPSQVSTARDMAILGQALARDFPRHYKYFSTANFTYAGKTYANHNHLMKTYPGMDGLKTGYIHASGYNLTASAVQNGRRLIGVVFGGRTSKTRNAHMKEILDAGFRRASTPQVAALLQQRAAAGIGNRPIATSVSRTETASDRVSSEIIAASATPPSFDAIGLVSKGLVLEQGDTNDTAGGTTAFDNGILPLEKPAHLKNIPPVTANHRVKLDATAGRESQPIRTAATSRGGNGTWAVQVGAFASHEAGMSALKSSKNKLPQTISGSSQYIIAPLMTNRGMIYRARLSGLEKHQAENACRILEGNCLILASQ